MDTRPTPTVRTSRAEDVLLAVLSLAAGPVLWWMAYVWGANPAASSMQTLESWIALGCGVLGVALSIVWLIFLLGGFCYVIGIKSRNTFLTSWSERITPKFLRRLLVSVFGAQLALTSQAFGSPSVEDAIESEMRVHNENAFMPPIAEQETVLSDPPPSSGEDNVKDTEPTAENQGSLPDAASPSETERIISELPTQPSPTLDESALPTPTPRHTTTIEITPDQPSDQPTETSEEPHPSAFVPDPPEISPYLTAPPTSSAHGDVTVVVTRGDCLWDIAHRELGSDASLQQIDERWRQWWQHNRDVIGENPHTIIPGTVLVSPPFTT